MQTVTTTFRIHELAELWFWMERENLALTSGHLKCTTSKTLFGTSHGSDLVTSNERLTLRFLDSTHLAIGVVDSFRRKTAMELTNVPTPKWFEAQRRLKVSTIRAVLDRVHPPQGLHI